MLPRYTAPRPWQPLSDAEMRVLMPFFARKGAGRPIFDLRGRLDAVFMVVTSPHPWKWLPEDAGPADTAARQFRRWAHAGVWTRLLLAVADPHCPPELRALEHWICRAYRRALRLLKLAGLVLARRLGLLSALNAPLHMLPDPDLSESCRPEMLRAGRAMLRDPRKVTLSVVQALMKLHRACAGRSRIPRWMAPP